MCFMGRIYSGGRRRAHPAAAPVRYFRPHRQRPGKGARCRHHLQDAVRVGAGGRETARAPAYKNGSGAWPNEIRFPPTHLYAEFARVAGEIAWAQQTLVPISASMKATADSSRALIAESRDTLRLADELLARR